MNNRETFKKNLNRLMLSRGVYAQVDLARYIGASVSTVSGWTRGASYPRADAMEKIAKFFGVTTFELVCEYDDQEEQLLRAFRVLSPYGKAEAIKRMNELKDLYWYDKKGGNTL